MYRQFVRVLFQLGALMTGFRVELAAGSALAYFAARVLAALCFSVRRGRSRAAVPRVTPL